MLIHPRFRSKVRLRIDKLICSNWIFGRILVHISLLIQLMENIWSFVCQMSNRGPRENSLPLKDGDWENKCKCWCPVKLGKSEKTCTSWGGLLSRQQLDGSCVIVETSYIFWCKQPKKVSRISLRKPKKLSVELEIHVKKYVTVCRGGSVCGNQNDWTVVFIIKKFPIFLI